MLFKKKKPKLDSKVRFQHKQFTTKLGSARQYKRTANVQPDNEVDKLLSRIGLGSRWTQIGVGLLVATALYIVYVPNFLTLKTITVTGVSDEQRREIEGAVRSTIAGVPFYDPQRNLFFLRSTLVETAVRKVASVQTVASVKKDFTNQAVQINAESKYNQVLLATPNAILDVYNDGTLHKTSTLSVSDWTATVNPAMIKVKVEGTIDASANAQIIAPPLFNKIVQLHERFKEQDFVSLSYIYFTEPSMPLLATQDLNESDVPAEGISQLSTESLPISFNELRLSVSLAEGNRRTFTVIVDVQQDITKTLDQLQMLMTQSDTSRLAALDYIDMRIDGKAFICLVSTPCSR